MPGGVQEDSVSVWSGLTGEQLCPEADCFRFSLVQVIDRQVDMHLLGHSGVAPRRRPIVRHSHGRDPASCRPYRNELVAARGYLAADQRSPELRQPDGIVTVEHNRGQSSDSHAITIQPGECSR